MITNYSNYILSHKSVQGKIYRDKKTEVILWDHHQPEEVSVTYEKSGVQVNVQKSFLLFNRLWTFKGRLKKKIEFQDLFFSKTKIILLETPKLHCNNVPGIPAHW